MSYGKKAIGKKSFDNLRDCVKQAFLIGCRRGQEFLKFRHAIIIEFKRLGYNSSEIKDKLLEWDKRGERPLGINEQRRQLLNYVDWVNENECRIGCKGLEDYCIGKKVANFTRELLSKRGRKPKTCRSIFRSWINF